jgi:hypothetical protein
MEQRIIQPMILALALFCAIPVSIQALAMDLGAGGRLIEESTKAEDGLVTLAATARHSSAAAIKTCNRIHNRSQRERCLGNMR